MHLRFCVLFAQDMLFFFAVPKQGGLSQSFQMFLTLHEANFMVFYSLQKKPDVNISLLVGVNPTKFLMKLKVKRRERMYPVDHHINLAQRTSPSHRANLLANTPLYNIVSVRG